jgi:signal transduction histidine kinase
LKGPGGIAARIAMLTLLVALLAVGIIAIGVLVVAQSTFNRLMAQAGHSAELAHTMFDHSVVAVFLIAALIAAVVSLVLASLLALRLARPLHEIAAAARRLAGGEYAARVQRSGPEEITSLADSFNQMAERLEEQERLRREFIINAAHELSTPLTNLQGYLEALKDGVIPPSVTQFQSLQEEVERLVRLSRSLQLLTQEQPTPRGNGAGNDRPRPCSPCGRRVGTRVVRCQGDRGPAAPPRTAAGAGPTGPARAGPGQPVAERPPVAR